MLMNLRDVPDDEIDDVRQLLRDNGIEFRETAPGFFGISAAGLWLQDETQRPQARALLDTYQQQRAQAAKAQRARELDEGIGETFGSLLRRRPFFGIGTLIAMLLVASMVLLPCILFRV